MSWGRTYCFIHDSFRFLRELFLGRRKFAHYDDCPLIRYRIDRGKLSDPVPLAKIPGIMKPIQGNKVRARFDDETKWRPINYYRLLWDSILVGPVTRKKLEVQRVDISETETEKRARILLAQINDSKPPTAAQRRTLADFKIDPALAKTRTDAKALIATCRGEKKAAAKAKREKEERAEAKKELEPESSTQGKGSSRPPVSSRLSLDLLYTLNHYITPSSLTV